MPISTQSLNGNFSPFVDSSLPLQSLGSKLQRSIVCFSTCYTHTKKKTTTLLSRQGRNGNEQYFCWSSAYPYNTSSQNHNFICKCYNMKRFCLTWVIKGRLGGQEIKWECARNLQVSFIFFFLLYISTHVPLLAYQGNEHTVKFMLKRKVTLHCREKATLETIIKKKFRMSATEKCDFCYRITMVLCIFLLHFLEKALQKRLHT